MMDNNTEHRHKRRVYLDNSATTQPYPEVILKMGQVMYDTHRGQAEDGEQITALLDRADELSEKTAELKERIAALRQAKICPACGAACGRDDQFCRRCGGSL